MKHTEEATRIVREKLGWEIKFYLTRAVFMLGECKARTARVTETEAYNALISTTEELLAAKEQVAKLEKVRAAAENIRHWHDSANDGMIVSAVAVRKLWEALDPRALDKKAGE